MTGGSGAIGSSGASGATGATGASGATGGVGVSGVSGAIGATGAPGISGDSTNIAFGDCSSAGVPIEALCSTSTISDMYVCVDTFSTFECVGSSGSENRESKKSFRMAVCSDASPCWQFSGELTKAALFPQVEDYFIWLIVLSIVGGVLLTVVVLLVIFLCSERKKAKQLNAAERIEALEGGPSFAAPEVDHRRAGNGVGDVEGSNNDPYPPPKQIRPSRIGRQSRGDLVLVNGEVVSKRARALSASQVEVIIASKEASPVRFASNQASPFNSPRIHRLSGSNAADLHLQDTLMNDPYSEDEEATHLKAGSLLKEKEESLSKEKEELQEEKSHGNRGAKNLLEETRTRAASHDSSHGADKGMRFATMLRSELSNIKLSKVEKKQDLVISTPVVTEKKDQRMTSGALEQLERDKRTLLAGLTADDIEAEDALEKKKPIKLTRQMSKSKNEGSSELIYNDPYAK